MRTKRIWNCFIKHQINTKCDDPSLHVPPKSSNEYRYLYLVSPARVHPKFEAWNLRLFLRTCRSLVRLHDLVRRLSKIWFNWLALTNWVTASLAGSFRIPNAPNELQRGLMNANPRIINYVKPKSMNSWRRLHHFAVPQIDFIISSSTTKENQSRLK